MIFLFFALETDTSFLCLFFSFAIVMVGAGVQTQSSKRSSEIQKQRLKTFKKKTTCLGQDIVMLVLFNSYTRIFYTKYGVTQQFVCNVCPIAVFLLMFLYLKTYI